MGNVFVFDVITNLCQAQSRIYVQESIAEKYLEGLKGAFAQFNSLTGDPAKETTQLGPLVDKQQFDRVMKYIEAGKEESTLITGGKRVGSEGYFIEPTIFTNAAPNAK